MGTECRRANDLIAQTREHQQPHHKNHRNPFFMEPCRRVQRRCFIGHLAASVPRDGNANAPRRNCSALSYLQRHDAQQDNGKSTFLLSFNLQ